MGWMGDQLGDQCRNLTKGRTSFGVGKLVDGAASILKNVRAGARLGKIVDLNQDYTVPG